jgi:hypothetical protein
MIPPSKTKESGAARHVPPSIGASRTERDTSSAAKTESAQKFMVWPEGRWERIATKAYELWEQRGCRQGCDLEDWLDAEAVVIQSLPAPPK